MGGPVKCSCGAILVSDVGADGVTLVSGEYVRFQRKTDYVVCTDCHLSYNIRNLLPPAAEEPTPVEKLERMTRDEPV